MYVILWNTYENLIYEGDNVIGDIIQNFPDLRLIDFIDRPNSSITNSGRIFNFINSSKISSVTFVVSNETISLSEEVLTSITVENTEKFSDFGYLLTQQKSILRYVSKTTTSFNCYVITGSSSLLAGDELVQYSYL